MAWLEDAAFTPPQEDEPFASEELIELREVINSLEDEKC